MIAMELPIRDIADFSTSTNIDDPFDLKYYAFSSLCFG